MRFRYSLQKVVDLKGSQKKQAEWMLSEAIGLMHKVEQSLESLMLEKHAGQEQLHAAATQPIPASELQAMQQYIEHLDRSIQRKTEDLSEAKDNVSGKQQLLMDRAKDEKVWLKAREHALTRYRAEANRQEQQQTDELVTMRHGL